MTELTIEVPKYMSNYQKYQYTEESGKGVSSSHQDWRTIAELAGSHWK